MPEAVSQDLPQQEAQAYESTSSRRIHSDRLRPWYGVTVVYLGAAALLLFVRRSEFGFGCEAATEECGSLRLNDIGDVAAGIFAPLAFLWLFVATLLQRKELCLQREELAETRLVLADQQKELERSARESNHQTDIMQHTLDAANSRDLFEEFNLKLYYISRMIYTNPNVIGYLADPAATKPHIELHFTSIRPAIYLSNSDISTVDLFYEKLRYNMALINRSLKRHHERTLFGSSWEYIMEMSVFATGMLKEYTDGSAPESNNKFVQIRIRLLRLDDLVHNAESVSSILERRIGNKSQAEQRTT